MNPGYFISNPQILEFWYTCRFVAIIIIIMQRYGHLEGAYMSIVESIEHYMLLAGTCIIQKRPHNKYEKNAE